MADKHNTDVKLSGPAISKRETGKVIMSMKNNKAPGLDGVQSEIFKLLCETDSRFLQVALLLFNEIYDSG